MAPTVWGESKPSPPAVNTCLFKLILRISGYVSRACLGKMFGFYDRKRGNRRQVSAPIHMAFAALSKFIEGEPSRAQVCLPTAVGSVCCPYLHCPLVSYAQLVSTSLRMCESSCSFGASSPRPSRLDHDWPCSVPDMIASTRCFACCCCTPVLLLLLVASVAALQYVPARNRSAMSVSYFRPELVLVK